MTGTAPPPAVVGSAPARADSIARDVLRDASYQSAGLSRESPGRAFEIPMIGGAFAGPTSGVLLGVLLVAIGWLVVGVGTSRTRRAVPRARTGGAAGGSPATLAIAQRLADEGRHDEAVHTLLLVALAHVSPDSGDNPSRTSREILRTLPRQLGADRIDALGELVGQVEWSLFGGRPLGAEDYARGLRRCRTILGAVG